MNRQPHVIAYADGSCIGNPGPGGWGVVLIRSDDDHLEFSGAAGSTTNNRMEITAAIEALRCLPPGIEVTIHTDSQYLVKTMTLGWKRRENRDLWTMLDAEVAQRKVKWEWVRGHAGDPLNERADELARSAALGKPQDLPADLLDQFRLKLVGEPLTPTDPPPETPSLSEQGQSIESTGIVTEETIEFENEAEVARLLRPLLGNDETLRRCAGCHRAFVATGNPPRMRAYCSLAACQLKRRRNPSG